MPADTDMTEETVDGFESVRERLEDGQPVLFDNGTAREFDLPGINDPEGMNHVGFGVFEKVTDDGKFVYYGGTAMYHDGDVSWTPVVEGQEAFLEHVDYDIDAVLETLNDIIE